MPQGKKSLAERVHFDFMLQNVNLLYLGLRVLILLDNTYVGRFWTQFEAWLSMQAPSAAGLTPAEDEAPRYDIMPIYSANEASATSLKDMWRSLNPEEARKKLENKDVYVTNESDKDKQARASPIFKPFGHICACEPCLNKRPHPWIDLSSAYHQLPKLIQLHEEVQRAFKDNADAVTPLVEKP